MSSLAKLPQHGHLQNNKIMVDSLAVEMTKDVGKYRETKLKHEKKTKKSDCRIWGWVKTLVPSEPQNSW